MKSAGEITEILEAFDLTGSLRDAAELAGCSHHTVARYVSARGAGGVMRFCRRSRSGWSSPLVALGYAGSERTTRRAIAQAKRAFQAGRVRVHRPWVIEPGMWLQYDFGDGEEAAGRDRSAWPPAARRRRSRPGKPSRHGRARVRRLRPPPAQCG